MSELENGRLVRLLTKMGFINERPEYVILITSSHYPLIRYVFLILGLEGHIAGQRLVTDTSSNSSEITSSTKWMKILTRSLTSPTSSRV